MTDHKTGTREEWLAAAAPSRSMAKATTNRRQATGVPLCFSRKLLLKCASCYQCAGLLPRKN